MKSLWKIRPVCCNMYSVTTCVHWIVFNDIWQAAALVITDNLLPADLWPWPQLTMFICFHRFYHTNNTERVLQKGSLWFNPLFFPEAPQLNLCCDHLKLWWEILNPAQLLKTVALFQDALPSHLKADAFFAFLNDNSLNTKHQQDCFALWLEGGRAVGFRQVCCACLFSCWNYWTFKINT